MPAGTITGDMDVVQLTLYAAGMLLTGLILYARQQHKREACPLPSEHSRIATVQGFPNLPRPKTFRRRDGSRASSPRIDPAWAINAELAGGWFGSPLAPIGNPMPSGVGPASYADRADVPDRTSHGTPRILPLGLASGFWVAEEDSDPRGMSVIGADGGVAGTVSEVWIDRDDMVVRYVEAAVPTAAGRRDVLVPMTLIRINSGRRQAIVATATAAQFADAPVLKSSQQITMREEDMVSAYFASGHLYATPARPGPLP